MNKKILRNIIIFIILLMPISSVFAKVPNVKNKENEYKYSQNGIWLHNQGIKPYKVKNKEGEIDRAIKENEDFELCVTANHCHKFKYSSAGKEKGYLFYLHEAIGPAEGEEDKYIFHGYCLNIGKSAVENVGKLLAHKSFSETKLSSKKQKLLEDLLSNSYHYNDTFKESTKDAKRIQKLKMIATQILVWEVVTGGRTNFDSYRPNGYSEANSFYTALVYTNKKSTTNVGDSSYSLYSIYTSIVDSVKAATSPDKVPSGIKNHDETNPYILKYNASKKKYVVTTGDLGKYVNIEDASGLNISKSASKLTISSDSYFTGMKKVTLYYSVGGSDTSLNNFYYFQFVDNNGNQLVGWQDIVLGAKSKEYKQTIYVKCDSNSIKINKIDGATNTGIRGVTFQIKDLSNKALQFVKSGANYTYTKTGGVTDIVEPTAFSYDIKGIPNGEYNVIETVCPSGYICPEKESDRTVKIKIANDKMYSYDVKNKRYNLVSNATVVFKNNRTKLEIYKTGNNAVPLNGVKFRLFYGDASTPVKLSCSSDNSVCTYNPSGADNLELITNISGKIEVNSLPKGNYKLQETATIGDYPLPEDPWWDIPLSDKNTAAAPYRLSVTNAKGQFNFYKMDQRGNYVSGGTFILQKYNKNTGSYEDIGVKEVEKTDSTIVYEIDEKSKDNTIKTLNGVATIKNIAADSKYKIVEIEAPEGYDIILDDTSSTAEVEVDKNGYAKTSSIIINKHIIVQTDATSNAELIVAINTGQRYIKYGLIISSIIAIITALFILRKKLSK